MYYENPSHLRLYPRLRGILIAKKRRETFILKSLVTPSTQPLQKSLKFLSNLKIHFPDNCGVNFSSQYLSVIQSNLNYHNQVSPLDDFLIQNKMFSFQEYFLFQKKFFCRICSSPPIPLHSFENYSTFEDLTTTAASR